MYHRHGAVMEANLCFGFRKSEWETLKEKFDDGDDEAWAQAIGVFERRIRERFLNCINALFVADTKSDLQPPESRHSENCLPGFSIMALCCLLIDTLQGFREKPPYLDTPAGPCTFPSGSCIKPPQGTTEQFKSFLRRPAFGDAFKDEALASKFVSGIRNGILHEAETRKWVVWRDEPVGQIVATKEDGFALNRTLFYEAVKREFESYLRELREPSNQALRQRFMKKMDDICKET
jgi:hypothetical protein